MPARKPVGSILALAALAMAGGGAEAAPRYPADGFAGPPLPVRQIPGPPLPVRAVGWPPECPGPCRRAPPPCAGGSRWFGPYGYVCYGPQRVPFPYGARTDLR